MSRFFLAFFLWLGALNAINSLAPLSLFLAEKCRTDARIFKSDVTVDLFHSKLVSFVLHQNTSFAL
jgi:hypothetical protein